MHRYHPRRRPALATLTIALVLLAGLSPSVLADCPGNLLTNGAFEAGFSARGAGEVEVANGWHPFYQEGPDQDRGLNHRPEYDAENAAIHGTGRIREGSYAQKWGKVFATHHAGIYQVVNVPAGSTLRLTAWAQAWSSDKDDPSVSDGGKYTLSVGIDPTGGTDWTSPNIVWSAPNGTLDQWVQLAVEARAQGPTASVFLRGDAEWPVKHNDAYYDDACLTSSAPPAPPTNTPAPTDTPAPTAEPGSEPTSAPTAEPTEAPAGGGTIHVVRAGEYLSLIAERYGVSMYEIAAANEMEVNDILRVGQELVIPGAATPTPVATATPEATPTPVGGTIRVAAFDDRDGNGLRGADEPLLAGARITLSTADGTVVGEHVTDGVSEPYAFQGLAPGDYVLAEENPPGYGSTRQDRWTITVPVGAEFEVYFADRYLDSPTPTTAPTPAPETVAPPDEGAPGGDGSGSGSPLDGLQAYSGVLVALLALVVGLGYRVIRARA